MINKSHFQGKLTVGGKNVIFNIQTEKQNKLTFKWGSWKFQNEESFRQIKDPAVGEGSSEKLIEKIKSAVRVNLQLGR